MTTTDEAVVRRFYEEMNNGRKNELAKELFTTDHVLLVVCRFSLWTVGFGTMAYACDAVGAA